MGDASGEKTNRRLHEEKDDDDDDDVEGCDGEAWETLNGCLAQVQSVLDQNRLLIQQVNENHQSQIHDNMVKNVSLIQEINANICKVISVYSKLPADFVDIVRRRRSENESNQKKKKKGCVDLNLPATQ